MLTDSTPKYHKTTFLVEVLSEGPYEGNTLSAITSDIDEGPCVGRLTRTVSTELSGQEAVEALKLFGSEPSFFNLDAEGNAIKDEDVEAGIPW